MKFGLSFYPTPRREQSYFLSETRTAAASHQHTRLVRCSLPQAQPGDHTRRCAATKTAHRSACGSLAPSSSAALAPALHKLRHSPAPCCTQLLAPASVLVAAIDPGRLHGITARARRSSAVAACYPRPRLSSLPACTPSCTAHPVPHLRETSRTAAACTHTVSCTRPRWRGPRTRMRTPRSLPQLHRRGLSM